MGQVVFLECLVVAWESESNRVSSVYQQSSCLVTGDYILLVVQEVVRKIVADVTEKTSAEYCHCDIPIPVENRMGKLIEGDC